MLNKVIRLVGIPKSTTSIVRPIVPVSDSPAQVDGMRDEGLQDAVELAKSYKTDVLVNGKVAWSYSDYAEKVKE